MRRWQAFLLNVWLLAVIDFVGFHFFNGQRASFIDFVIVTLLINSFLKGK